MSGVNTDNMFAGSGGGSVSVADGTCELCGFGKYRNAADGSCAPCPVGSYAPLPPSWSSGAVGVESCIPCPAGHYNPGDGSVACFPCAPGTFQPEGGFHASCIPCPGGFFGVDEGQTSCDDTCPAGTYSTGGATSCFSFTSETLRAAVTAWCAGDKTTYGHISEWVTGGVTDMVGLFAPSGVDITPAVDTADADFVLKSGACGDGDSNDFDADISKWDGKSINFPQFGIR